MPTVIAKHRNVNRNVLTPIQRFRGFNDNWKEVKFSDVFSFKPTNSLSRDALTYETGQIKNIHYGDIHTKYRSRFYISREQVPYIKSDINLLRVSDESYCKVGDIVIADASEDYQDIGKSIEMIEIDNQKILAGLHTFIARPKSNTFALGFLGYLMRSHTMRLQIMTLAQGTKVLGISTKHLNEILFKSPSLLEQQKVASFLSSVDQWIESLQNQKKELESYKKGIMQKIFSQEFRFKDDSGNSYLEWNETTLQECLDYEQPTPYIVNSTEYDDSYPIPVLTAGKSFILGYTNEGKGIYENNLPVIIFDDFTTTSQFVDFPFKVKSSAMKILKAKNNCDISFIYEAMKRIRYEISGHGRHWISNYSKIKITIPSLEEQEKISSFAISLDSLIKSKQQQIIQVEQWKKGLMQKLFI